MQKFYLKYIKPNGETTYVENVDFDKSISLSYTEKQNKATIFYGDGGMNIINNIIKNDIQNHNFSQDNNYCYEIEAVEQNAIHHFELIAAIRNEFGEDNYKAVNDNFPLDEHEEYTNLDTNGKPIIDSLSHWELQRYYNWLKDNNPNHISEPAGFACARKNNLKVNEVREISTISFNTNLTLSDREWTCDCGKHLIRDENAAINILNQGLQLL